MKKLKICSMMLLALMMPLFLSCGGDDDSPSNGSFNMVDGVHVNERKLLYLDVYKQSYSETYQKELKSDKIRFTMSYDSKGRLIKISAPFITYFSGEHTTLNTLMTIDYDLKLIEYVYEGSKSTYQRCFFSLNSKGFISRLGDCELSYNDEGYLTGANTEKNIWTFAYNDGDIIKYMVEKLKTGNIDIFYAHYAEKEGDLFFAVNDPDGFRDVEGYPLLYCNYRTISLLIAYHAGLFGNISKYCIDLPNSSSKNAIIEQFSDVNDKSIFFHCSFVFD